MSKLDRNIQLARRCIEYVNALHVKSINVPFRLATYYKFSNYHYFVLGATRCETRGVPERVLTNRRFVLQTVADQTKSRKQKRALVKAQINRLGVTYFDDHTPKDCFDQATDRKDEMRIRLCRRAMKTRHGNCMEKSALTATWLLENRPGDENILWVAGNAYDHAWVVFDPGAPKWDGVIANLSDDAVVADGWTGDYYQAKHPQKFWHGGLANPFQLTIRNRVRHASGNIGVLENVRPRDWAESFSPHFRLDYADQPPSTYEPQWSYLLRVYKMKECRSARDEGGFDEAKAIQAVLDHVEDGDDELELEDD
jgi:hypothetical protein